MGSNCLCMLMFIGLPPDLMHDVLEGAAVVEMKCLLEELIVVKKVFSLSTLNSRIKNFPFGYCDLRSKPLPLPDHLLTNASVALKQSGKNYCLERANSTTISFVASQTWCLIRLLPLMVGDLIPQGDPN